MYVRTVDFTANNACDEFTKSIHETGFAVIKNHPISQDLIDQVLDEWQAFFKDDKKHSYLPEPGKQDGYFPYKIENAKGSEYSNLMEYFHYFQQCGLPEGMSEVTKKLFTQMQNVALTLVDWLDEMTPKETSKNFEMPIREMVKDSPNSLMRIIHYPPLDGSETPGEIRAGEHEDIDLITLICGATTEGLQAKDNEGNWHAVRASADMIVVNAGDMLQELSQGYYRSTTHRVINPEGAVNNKPRYSMPFFFHPWPEVKLSENVIVKDFLKKRLVETGVFDESQDLKVS